MAGHFSGKFSAGRQKGGGLGEEFLHARPFKLKIFNAYQPAPPERGRAARPQASREAWLVIFRRFLQNKSELAGKGSSNLSFTSLIG